MKLINNSRVRLIALMIIMYWAVTMPRISAQVTNDNEINYQTKLTQLKWNLRLDADGASDPVWRLKYNKTGPAWTTADRTNFSHFSSDPSLYCFQGYHLNDQNPKKVMLSGIGTGTKTTRQYFLMQMWESDADNECGDLSDADGYHGVHGDFLLHGTHPNQWIVKSNETNNLSTYKMEAVFRYLYGDNVYAPLTFDNLSDGNFLYHYNSNRKAPSEAPSYTGYTNTTFNTSPDVFYSFVVPEGDPMEVTISTDYGSTNFDTYLRLLAVNTQIDSDDNGGTSYSNTSEIKTLLCPGTYTIIVEGSGNSQGEFILSVSGNTISSNELSSAGTIEIERSVGTTDIELCPDAPLLSVISTTPYTSNFSSEVELNYVWEKKIDANPWTTISGALSKDYEPLINMTSDSIKYRRALVTGVPPYFICPDIKYSNEVKFVRYNPTVNGGTISLNGINEIEEGDDPGTITSDIDASGYPQNLHVEWYKSDYEDGVWKPWSKINEATGQQIYDIPVLTQSVRYRRRVRNGCSGDTYSNTVQVDVFPADGTISGRIATPVPSDVGVSNVVVTARRTIGITGGPQDVTYTAITDNNGDYTISDIYYGSGSSEFEVTPSLRSAIFSPLDTTIIVSDSSTHICDFIYNIESDSIIYVNANVVGGSGNGNSWANAYANLQDAILASNVSTGVIRRIYIAKGVYKPSVIRSGESLDQQKTFQITRDVKIYGGFEGNEVGPEQRTNIEANATVISGDLGGSDVTDSLGITINSEGITTELLNTPSDNAYHVFYLNRASSETVFDGLIITGGYAAASSGEDSNGGGVYCTNQSANIFGFDPPLSSSPQFINTLFVGNRAKLEGGAIFIPSPVISDEIVLHFSNCEFRSNTADKNGGAIHIENEFNSTIVDSFYNCHFIDNDAGYSGGAVYNSIFGLSYSYSTFDHCTFSMNRAYSGGSAIHASHANSFGLNGTNSIKISSSSFYNNAGMSILNKNIDDRLIIDLIVQNSIIRGGTISSPGGVATIVNTIVEGGFSGQQNIFDLDPDFITPDAINQYAKIGGYLQLSLCSPALDKGANDVATQSTDVSGNYRIQDSRPGGIGESVDSIIDLGPYEINDPFHFVASKDSTDSWIHFEWSLDPINCNCLDEDSGLGGVTVELRRSNNDLVGFETIYPEVNDTNTYSGTFLDYVGPDITDTYRLEINKNGSGATNCHQLSTGSTLPFAVPEVIASDDIAPDSISISWTNRSWLSDVFRIYREQELIAEIPGSSIPGGTFNYTDVYRMNNTFSLVNGQQYDYYIETISRINPDIGTKSVLNEYILEDRGFDDGSTLAINLMASVDNPSDRVILDWDDMSAYAHGLQIIRGGDIISAIDFNDIRQIHGSTNPNILDVLGAAAISYEDIMPIHGDRQLYGIELLKDGQAFVGTYDFGRVPPNGIVSGLVLTNKDRYPVANTVIQLSYILETLDNNLTPQYDTVTVVTLSAYDGSFMFDNIIYGNEALMTITASPGTDIPYVENPLYITLNNELPRDSSLVFYAKTEFDKGEPLSSLTSFTATPMNQFDRIDLNWSYIPSNVNTHFNLYRDNELLGQYNDSLSILTSYQDTSGIPEKEYTYSLVAYQIMDTIVIDTTISVTETFPAVASPQIFDAAVDFSLGNITVSWVHNSTNVDGYRLYRNNQLIYDGPDKIFIDLYGEPGSNMEYYVEAYRYIDEITYISPPSVIYYRVNPDLPRITDFVANTDNNRDRVELKWTVPAALINGYNYTGFNIYRVDESTSDTIVLKTINAYAATAGEEIVIYDKTGVPNNSYIYYASTFLETPKAYYESSSISSYMILFPNIAAINYFDFGSGPTERYVYWIQPSDNIDGFEVYKGENKGLIWDSRASNPAPPDFYYDDSYYPSTPEEQSDTIYFSAAYRDVDGMRYYSDTISYEDASPDSINFSFLTSFTASQDQAEHVKLCWEWNSVSALWPFVIERDNVIIDTVQYTARSYYDYSAPIGVELTYSIRALSQDQNVPDSDKIIAIGKIPSGKTISGRVYQQSTGKGLASVKIIAQGSNNKRTTQTDASGFYQFNDLVIPKYSPSWEMTLIADSINTSYNINPQTITIYPDTIDLTIDFIDTYEMNSFNKSISELVALTATPQHADMNVSLSWSPDNTNHDGFEIFKGTEQIGTVLKGYPLQWIDDSGAPGALTAYSVRAFQLDPMENKLYGAFRLTAAVFPKIEPIQNLTFIDILDLNQVYVQWSHPYDNHDFYLIQRNGVNVAIVQTGNELLYIDSTGIPEQTYNYNIVAYARDGLYQSVGVSGEHNYPMVNALRTTVDITDPINPEDENNHMNHLLLTWDYNDPTIDSFTIYRYELLGNTKINERTIARVSGDSRRYEDYTVEPGVRYYYEVLATEIRNGNEYYSQRRLQFAQDTFYQQISFASNRIATANAEKGWMELRFTYEYPTVDSFSITRQVVGQSIVEEIASFAVADYQMGNEVLYIDKNGIPETIYDYKVIAYSKRNGIFYSSESKAFGIFTPIERQDSIKYNAVDVPLNLPVPVDTVRSFINVAQDIIIESIQINIEGTYVFPKDLVLKLTSPQELSYTLLNQTCGEFDWNFDIGFSDESVLGLLDCSPNYPADGDIFMPVTPLGTLNGQSSQGEWTLEVIDVYPSQYGGQVNAWSIVLINTVQDTVLVPMSFEYPKIPSPLTVNASDGTYQNKIDVDWTYDPEINVDGFIIKRKLSTDISANQLDIDGDVPGGRRMISDATDDITTTSQTNLADYEVQAYRFIPGLGYYYSDTISNPGYAYQGALLADTIGPNINLGHTVSLGSYNNIDWAIVGTDQAGKAYIYKKSIDGSWIKYQTITGPEERFGSAVSMSGKYAVIGSPLEDNRRGGAYIYQYNNTSKRWEQMGERLVAVTSSRDKDRFGSAVDIIDDSEDYVIIGAPGDNNAGVATGAAYIFRRNSNQWEYAHRVLSDNPIADSQFGLSVTIGKTKTSGHYYSMIGAPDYGDMPNNGRVYFYKKDSATINKWTYSTYSWLNGISDDFFGRSIDLSGDYLLVANKLSTSQRGVVYFYKYNGSSWDYHSALNSPNPADIKQFGSSVSVIDGETHDYALIGESYDEVNGGVAESAYLYEWNGSTWGSPINTYSTTDSLENHEFGRHGAINEKYALVSAIRTNNEFGDFSGAVHFYDIDPSQNPLSPTNVIASDGDFQNKVNVEWTYGNTSNIQEFSIIRDGQFLGSVTNEVRFYEDKIDNNDLTPGRLHHYSVVAKKVGGLLSEPASDLGHVPANGIVEGMVVAVDGISPVEGVSIYASTSLIDGESFSYGPIVTGADGTFEFNNVYYGDEADVTINASLMGHVITPDSRMVTLSKTGTTIAPIESNVIFTDQTAYTVNGVIRYAAIEDCGIENIELEYVSVLNNGSTIINKGLTEAPKTDANGAYSFVIDPFLDNLDYILIRAKDTMLIGNEGNSDTLFYNFEAQGSFDDIDESGQPLFLDLDNLSQINTIDFIDVTTYKVEIYVENTCGEPLTDNGEQFSIKAFTRDGCYEVDLLLDVTGYGSLQLPPVDMVLVVTDITDYTNPNGIYLDYLMSSPTSLGLYNFHKDEALFLNSTQQIESLQTKLTYHLPPRISVDLTMLDNDCMDVGVISQNGEYTIPLAVSEEFESGLCPVNGGYLLVKNGAARDGTVDTILYDSETEGFEDYRFIGGRPNVVAPHVWSLTIEYFSDADVFQGKASKGIFVEGQVGTPGNGIMVDAGNGTQEVPLPLYVLRDPPGDASYSTIEKGFSLNKSIEWSGDIGGAVGINNESEFKIAGVGAVVSGEFKLGGSAGKTNSIDLTYTSTESFSTSDSEDAVGPEADVIIGLGLAMQYGINTSYTFEGCTEDGPEVKETRRLGLTPNSVETTWIRSVEEIRTLIDEYDSNATLYESGEEVYEENGQPVPPAQAGRKFRGLRDNWLAILDYHQKETNPFYYLCTKDFTTVKVIDNDIFYNPIGDLISGLLEKIGIDDSQWRGHINSLGIEANAWGDALLTVLDENGDGIPDSDITFDNTKLIAYNNAAYAIRELMKETGGTIEGYVALIDRVSNYGYSPERLFSESFAPKDEMAKNITFTGNAGAYTESYSQDKSLTNTLNFSLVQEASAAVGVKTDVPNQIFTGIGAGIIKKITEFESTTSKTIEESVNINHSRGTTTDQSQSVSYTLDDDDVGDELSVTILKSIDLNHTPFFQLLGGETSCPWETGSISRHGPIIQVLDENGAAGDKASRLRQDADEPVEFTVVLTNKSPTKEVRGYEVFLYNSTNPDNASLSLAGSNLGIVRFPEEAYDIPKQVTLTIDRGTSYDYRGLKVGIRPINDCDDDWEASFITLDVTFESECSPVSIVSPGDNWLVNSRDLSTMIKVRDYDVTSAIFEQLTWEYRRIDADLTSVSEGWNQIPDKPSQMNPLSKDQLADHNEEFFGPGKIPNYLFNWTLDNSSLNRLRYPDGDYELRVKVTCQVSSEPESYSYSNIISGSIMRSGLQLIETLPADGSWVAGDIIEVSFNKDIECSKFDDPEYVDQYMKVYDENNIEVQEASFVCFNNKIRVNIPDMTFYDGQDLTVVLDSIYGTGGNIYYNSFDTTSQVTWSFNVNTRPAYIVQDSFVIELYEAESVGLSTELINTGLVALPGLQLTRSTNSASWLSSSSPGIETDFTLNNTTKKEDIFLTVLGLTEGEYRDTLVITGLPGNEIIPTRLPIKVTVNKRPPTPPNWTVDELLYPNSMTVAANFEYTDQPGLYSDDVLDQISVYINGELRGLGRLEDPGNGNHVAYITVYGSSADNGEVLEFKVWDSSEDLEFNGTPPLVINYDDGDFVGSSVDRIILSVDLANQARYIPLNQGWTWFSMNTDEADMSIAAILSDIDNPAPGDRIVGQSGFAEYINSSIGWYASASFKLDSLNTEDSYMIYLANQADSIRVTGLDATVVNGRLLLPGWHWVGYPMQEEQLLPDAIELTTIHEFDQIRTRENASQWLDDNPGFWDGTLGMLYPNGGYKIEINESATLLNYNSSAALAAPIGKYDVVNLKANVYADTSNADTWALDLNDYKFENVIPIIGEVYIDNVLETSGKISAFVDDRLVGVANIEDIPQLGMNAFTLMIGLNPEFDLSEIRLHYSSSTGALFHLNDVYEFVNQAQVSSYNYLDPLKIYLGAPPACQNTLTVDDNNIAGNIYKASNLISSSGTIFSSENVEFRAGSSIELNPDFEVQLGAQFLAIIEDCNPNLIKEDSKIEFKRVNKSFITIDNAIEQDTVVTLTLLEDNQSPGIVKLDFELLESGQIDLQLIPKKGKWSIPVIVPEKYGSGSHSVELDFSKLPLGAYSIVLQTEDGQSTVTYLNQTAKKDK